MVHDARSAAAPAARNVHATLEASARAHPGKVAIAYYGREFSYADLLGEVEALAGYLQDDCGIVPGDRILLYMQNSPQYVAAFYAILRADAVVIPVNPMNLTEELSHYVHDAAAKVAICAAELVERVLPLAGESGLTHIIVAAYGEKADLSVGGRLPEVVRQVPESYPEGVTPWSRVIGAGRAPKPSSAGPDDLAVMPYTSGTTGLPKGCMHTHGSLLATIVWAGPLKNLAPRDVLLAVVPFFHVTGMLMVMGNAVNLGATMVIMTRWDRDLALDLIAGYGVTAWVNIPTMILDLLASPNLTAEKMATLHHISGGGTGMPEAVAKKLHELTGVNYREGYGLTETAAATHFNPIDKPKRQCLGLPVFDTESLVVDPVTLLPLPPGEIGEIVSRGPQVFKGYWNNPEATANAFVEISGKTFFRTGDLARVDEDGYFFMVDRLKRMINASGYKVWPAEVEAMMYGHPAVQEVCIIAAKDPKRGETVKAVVVLKPGQKDKVSGEDLLHWAKENMSTYKAPRLIEIVNALPRNATGKILWRVLQEQEDSKAG
ncbi:MAG: AMP-binding protein [Notoacmeibacter sp.]|nr:AMP-binding protein [Notoacmeibacter sp.]MCC0032025.1 AMP-binding protein [Brucellaceae bacterium]